MHQLASIEGDIAYLNQHKIFRFVLDYHRERVGELRIAVLIDNLPVRVRSPAQSTVGALVSRVPRGLYRMT